MPKAEGTTITEPDGGKHSYTLARFDCIPAETQILLAQCLGFGAEKYGEDNWKGIPLEKNLGHAINHIQEFRRGDTKEPHLVNAYARLTFALWQAVDQELQDGEYVHPEMVVSLTAAGDSLRGAY